MIDPNSIFTVASKITTRNKILNVFGTTRKGNYFANGKKYWIEYGDGEGRRALNSSNSLKYIMKKFEERT